MFKGEVNLSKGIIEYKKFLTEYQYQFNEYERKIAFLILRHFDKVESTTTARGNRAKTIVGLLDEQVDITEEMMLEGLEAETTTQLIRHLSSLTVENFRGFTNKLQFSLNLSYTFIYGPNGTGKSSLCEALEYSLLGTIYEAENKRININQYIQNVYTKKGQLPILTGIDKSGQEVNVLPSLSDYEFCFIERNRIEGFARVSANTPQNQQQRLATLFGLEDFNNFVRNFNDKIESYIDCVGKKGQELVNLEKKVEGYKRELDVIPNKKETQDNRITELLKGYPGIKNLRELKEKINGNQEKKGLLEINNKEIAELSILKVKQVPNVASINTLLDVLKEHISEYVSLSQDIKSYKDDLSLRDLYKLILKTQNQFENNCPACFSELYINGQIQVPVDPYQNAQQKIGEFERIIALENRVEDLGEQIGLELQSLKKDLIEIANIAQTVEFSNEELIRKLAERISDIQINDTLLKETVFEIEGYLGQFREVKKVVVEHNEKVTNSYKRINKLKDQNDVLNKTLDTISDINAKMNSLVDIEEVAVKAIKEFNDENSALIKEAKEEKLIVERNIKFNEAYISFKSKLEEYNRELPSKLVKNLNDNTLSIYNAINRYDHPSDLLEELRLPEGAGERIEIRFKEGSEIDALHVLSEGHLRCLGLSILLAKIVNEELPFIIFDDVVNAIDDEHRKGIIETILGDKKISNKQLIVTTHGEEFVKELENNIPKKEYTDKVNRIDFLKFDDTNKIAVRMNSSRNYLMVAQSRLREYQYRDCLANCRRALESLLNRLWKQLSKKYNIQVSVQLRNPDSKPELMGVAQSLKKTIKKQTNGEYSNILPLLEELIGDNNRHRIEWNYLNKGTHDEERESEFDPIVVKDIYKLLEKIDDLIMT